jgi:hypothetical protein
MSNFYPSLLKPTGKEIFIIGEKAIEVPKTILTLKKWTGLPIANTFGGKALIDFDGVPMFAELAIMKLFIISGWQARWVETYGDSAMTPRHFSNWIDGRLTEQNIDLITNDRVLKAMNSVSILNGDTYSGCWDVIGWSDDHIIFAELKRTKKDNIRQTQHKWLTAGIKSGLKADNFLIVQWDFIGD